jgi:hypothetical protein
VVEATVFADDYNHVLDGRGCLMIAIVLLTWIGGKSTADCELEYRDGH